MRELMPQLPPHGNVRHIVRGTLLTISLVLAGCAVPQPSARFDPVAVIGDSLAHGLTLEATNLGINGARTWNVLKLLRTRAAESVIRRAGAVVVSIGGNDLYGDARARLFSTLCPSATMHLALLRVDAIVRRVHALNPAARVILLGLYDPYRQPFLDQQVNNWDGRLILHFAADRRVTVIRIADLFLTHDRLSPIDHFHPSAEGYALIAARITSLR
jgi:lysophospholipase L1-like esterase